MSEIHQLDFNLIHTLILAPRSSSQDLEHIDEVSRKHIVSVPMKPGDVIFVDNYRMLHGRDIFKGDRFHAVAWFGDQVHIHVVDVM